jgi:hypothetical protein
VRSLIIVETIVSAACSNRPDVRTTHVVFVDFPPFLRMPLSRNSLSNQLHTLQLHCMQASSPKHKLKAVQSVLLSGVTHQVCNASSETLECNVFQSHNLHLNCIIFNKGNVLTSESLQIPSPSDTVASLSDSLWTTVAKV